MAFMYEKCNGDYYIHTRNMNRDIGGNMSEYKKLESETASSADLQSVIMLSDASSGQVWI